MSASKKQRVSGSVKPRRGFIQIFRECPARGWILIFLLSNTFLFLPNNANPHSRLATLCAMVEDKSFSIDNYKDWTIDWAHVPGGHYYSNKAPGPMLLGYPIFWAIDKIITMNQPDRAERDRVRLQWSWLTLKLLSLLLQTIPFAILVVLALDWLKRRNVPPIALHLSCVAMLFGNTASLFMNTYFGHALTATCVLGLCLALLLRRYGLSGLAFGLALLSDYSSAVLLPGFLGVVILQEPRKNWLKCGGQIALGGLVPGILWIFYHTVCFGGPFTLPNRYQNPEFVDTAGSEILGLFSLKLHPSVFGELLFGFRRGILWSQPWVLFVLVAVILRRRLLGRISQEAWLQFLPLVRFVLPGFGLLLFMNASFGQWHGGWTAGPRYMSSIFPALGLLAGPVCMGLSTQGKRCLFGLVGMAVIFWMVVFSTTQLVPTDSTLWGFTLGALANPPNLAAIICLIVLGVVFQWQLALAWSQNPGSGNNHRLKDQGPA